MSTSSSVCIGVYRWLVFSSLVWRTIRLMSEAPKHFEKTSVPLPAGHGWRCKEGNSLFVADRGAATFEIPSGWVVRHDQNQTLCIHDRPPPDDACRISLTIFHLPPVRGGWGVALSDLIQQLEEMERSSPGDKTSSPARRRDAIHTERRPDLELVWTDKGCSPDRENGKPRPAGAGADHLRGV